MGVHVDTHEYCCIFATRALLACIKRRKPLHELEGGQGLVTTTRKGVLMNSTPTRQATTFADMAAQLGLRPRLLYSIRNVADVLGVDVSTINDEITAGRMKYHLPPGRIKGKLIRPEWVDEWLEDGTHERTA